MPSNQCCPSLLEKPCIAEHLLMGPGPTDFSNTVKESFNLPVVGYLDPQFTHVMDECKMGIQCLFQTKNWLTFAVPGTGHAGIECAVMNLMESGETMLVVVAGTFGHRVCELGKRLWLKIETEEAPEGEAIPPERIISTIKEKEPKAVYVCHGESSTGVLQSLVGIGEACHEVDALLIVDAVSSAGGVKLNVDELKIDCAFTATQKVLNAPAGLAPITFSQRAFDKISKRVTPVPSFYFDVMELGNYWGCFKEKRHYHHTGMALLVYALRATLGNLMKTGLKESIKKHEENADYFWKKLEENGFKLFVQNRAWRLPTLTTIEIPEGICAKNVTTKLLENKIEIGIGMGPSLNKIFRIGTFGKNSDKEKIDHLVCKLKNAMDECCKECKDKDKKCQ